VAYVAVDVAYKGVEYVVVGGAYVAVGVAYMAVVVVRGYGIHGSRSGELTLFCVCNVIQCVCVMCVFHSEFL